MTRRKDGGLCSANDRARLDAFLRRCKRYGYCADDVAGISDLFGAADRSLFQRVPSNELHVLQPLLYLTRLNLVTTCVHGIITDRQ